MGSDGPINQSSAPPAPINTQFVNNTKSDMYQNRPDLNASINNNNSNINTRPEMKGPDDLDNILSGLKTKSLNNIQGTSNAIIPDNNSSTISITELKELQGVINIPKKTNRIRKNKNVISLTEI
jgi:hypothetical protein